MLAVIAFLLVASAYAQTCSKPLDMFLKVGTNYLCPNNQGCIINKVNDNLSFCCALSDINNTPATPVTVAPVVTCKDLLNPATGYSDCPQRAYLCNNSAYYQLMTEQCPKTCNRCGSQPANNNNNGNTNNNNNNNNNNNGSNGACVDKVNPANGISDCPNRRAYCNNPAYLSLMRDQCPRTCAFC